MVEIKNADATVRDLLQANFDSNLDVEIFLKRKKDGKAINKKFDGEIQIQRGDATSESANIFNTAYNREVEVIIEIQDVDAEDFSLIDETKRILENNNRSKDLPNGYDYFTYEDTVEIPSPRFNSTNAVISINLHKRFD